MLYCYQEPQEDDEMKWRRLYMYMKRQSKHPSEDFFCTFNLGTDRPTQEKVKQSEEAKRKFKMLSLQLIEATRALHPHVEKERDERKRRFQIEKLSSSLI